MYYELLRAKFSGVSDSYNDPFPGVSNVTSISNLTQPSLRTWDGKMSRYAFVNIAEADSIITLDVIKDNSKSSIEDFEKMPLGTTLNERGVEGVYAHWDFYNCAVVDTVQVDNGHSVAMRNGSYLNTVENLNKIPVVVRFTVTNPTDTKAVFYVHYSKNNGQKWFEADYPGYLEVPANSSATAAVTTLPTNVPIMLRIKQTMGSSTDYCFLDNVEICYENTWTPEFTVGDVNDDGMVNIADVTRLIDYLLDNENTANFNVNAANVNGDADINIADVTALIDRLLNSAD